MSHSDKNRRSRTRRQHGVSVVAVPIDRLGVADALISSGRLKPVQCLERRAVASALSAVIEEWAEQARWEATEDAPVTAAQLTATIPDTYR